MIYRVALDGALETGLDFEASRVVFAAAMRDLLQRRVSNPAIITTHGENHAVQVSCCVEADDPSVAIRLATAAVQPAIGSLDIAFTSWRLDMLEPL